MDPKHQFAAQYVLSRAAAERREREILASSSLGIKETERGRFSSPIVSYQFTQLWLRFSLVRRVNLNYVNPHEPNRPTEFFLNVT